MAPFFMLWSLLCYSAIGTGPFQGRYHFSRGDYVRVVDNGVNFSEPAKTSLNLFDAF